MPNSSEPTIDGPQTERSLEADYLVVGTGAMGIAFADEILRQRPNARLVLTDRRGKPGGHWNDAYSYVSLHQPAAFYGVNSEFLGPGGNALATGSEVLAYYERVLLKLIRTDRVTYLPLCDYRGEGRLQSLVDPDVVYLVQAQRTVDSTYMNVQVPQTTPPRYEVADDAMVVPPNRLPHLASPPPEIVVVGAGKTAMDAVLFMLRSGARPGHIRWVRSNDSWLLDRSTLYPGHTVAWFADQLEVLAQAASVDDVFLRTEAGGTFLRIDADIWPKKFRCATVDREEVELLRQVKQVVRLGRVERVEKGRLTLEGGQLDTSPDALHIDCTANPLARRPKVPVFDDDTIVLQSLFMCQQVFSAAAIAYVEARPEDQDAKNSLCRPVPHPEVNLDYLKAMNASNSNMNRWAGSMSRWLRTSRLSLAYHESFFGLLRNLRRAKAAGPGASRNVSALLAAGE